MFRKKLDEGTGMWFIFSDDAERVFWMKNVSFPLDMIFISRDFKIVDIKYAEPCIQDQCTSYVSSKLAKYVLEVNGNFTIRRDIAVGNEVKLKV